MSAEIDAALRLRVDDFTGSLVQSEGEGEPALRVQLAARDAVVEELSAALSEARSGTAGDGALAARLADKAAECEELRAHAALAADVAGTAQEQAARAVAQASAAAGEVDALRAMLSAAAVSAGPGESGAHSQLLESLLVDKRGLEDANARLLADVSALREAHAHMLAGIAGLEDANEHLGKERAFADDCLAEARRDVQRAEEVAERGAEALHEAQLGVAKAEGRAEAAQMRLAALEKEAAGRKAEIAEVFPPPPLVLSGHAAFLTSY
jgi:chromosome segregation ATPase